MKISLVSKKILSIKALFLDVDGVLTDGGVYIDANGQEIKRFHVQDGYGIKQLQNAGITLAIISGRKSAAVTHRMQELGIEHVYQGIGTKLEIYQQLKDKLQLNDSNIAYMGDDTPDLAIIKQAGLGIAPQNAVAEVKRHAHWITDRCGGDAAVREVSDFMIHTYTYHNNTATT